MNFSDKIFFKRKINKLYKDFISCRVLLKADLIHAHFLYSDGALALKIKKKLNIKYIVAVRNTDINYFFKLRPDLYFLMLEILQEAEKVIFLNHGYKFRLLKLLSKKNRDSFKKKFEVIPNGINDDWLMPTQMVSEHSDKIKLIYVGDFTKNKNVPILIDAVSNLSSMGFDVSLKLAGGGGNQHNAVINKLKKHSNLCEFLGRMNITDLKKLYRNSDILVVPSKYETFGMVYIEALSQGCQVIFKEGEAISGYLNDDSIALGLSKINVKEIVNSIIKLHNSDKSRRKCSSAAEQFSLSGLSKKYFAMYSDISINI